MKTYKILRPFISFKTKKRQTDALWGASKKPKAWRKKMATINSHEMPLIKKLKSENLKLRDLHLSLLMETNELDDLLL